MTSSGDGWNLSVSEDWKQGRTLYGGISSALCLAAALRSIDSLPLLRSAQFAFVGPAAGELRIIPSVLRRGKSTVFASVDLFGETGLATRAMLCFGAPRQSSLSVSTTEAPRVARPADCPPFVHAGGNRPAFLDQFDTADAGGGTVEFLLWARLRHSSGIDQALAATLLADIPPPAVTARFGGGAPASTMTWQVDYLQSAPADDDGWRLVRSRAESAGAGYSSQAMEVWTQAGARLIAGRQTVAVFA